MQIDDIYSFLDREYPRLVTEISHNDRLIRILSDLDRKAYVVTSECEFDKESIDILPEEFHNGYSEVAHAMLAVAVLMNIKSNDIFRLIAEKADKINIYYIDGILN